MHLRQWQGLRVDTSIVGDEGMYTATNIALRIAGELRRRPGLNKLFGNSAYTYAVIAEYTDSQGTRYFYWNSVDGSINSYNTSSGAIGSPWGIANHYPTRGCFVRSNGRLYFTDGFNSMVRFEGALDGTGNPTAGITGPSAVIGSPATSTGSVVAGTHGLRYRYFDSKSLYLSDPSTELDLTLTGAVTLSFSVTDAGGGGNIIRSTDAKVDQIIVEMTPAGSSTFYRAATFNQSLTGTSINLADSDLELQVTAARDGDFGHQPPPMFSLAVEHRGRLFGWGQTSVTLTGVSVSSSSASATVTGSTVGGNWAGFLVRFGSDAFQYRISAVSGGTTMVLSQNYSGTTATVSAALVYHATPDMLYWTRAGFPESWYPTAYARRVLQNQSDTPSGLWSNTEILYLFGQRTIRALDYTTDPAGGRLLQVATELGLWNQRCLVEADGRIYGWGRSGAWYLNDVSASHISSAIDERIDGTDTSSTDIFDTSKLAQFHGVFDPWERCITWFYATSAESKPKHGIRYDLKRREWSITTFRQAITASCQSTGGGTERSKALVGDENGFTWYLTPELFDGVPSSLSGGVVTVNGTGATTTLIPVSETLVTGASSNLIGVMATYSNQDVVIISNQANSILLNSALSAAPTNQSEVYLGSIAFAVSTKWVSMTDLKDKQRPQFLAITMVPGVATGKLTLKFYTDFSTTPVTLTRGAGDTLPDGLSWANGDTSATVDLDAGSGDGLVCMPLTMQFHRAIRAEITSTRPQGIIRLLDLEFVVRHPRSVGPAEDE